MPGLLADVNLQGHLPYRGQLLANLGLWEVLAELKLELVTFRDLKLLPRLDDRSLWNYCQEQGWTLFTENRNHDGPDSLHATLIDSWQVGHLPSPDASEQGEIRAQPRLRRTGGERCRGTIVRYRTRPIPRPGSNICAAPAGDYHGFPINDPRQYPQPQELLENAPRVEISVNRS
jgi:hypothetical protein